jgi:DNA-3-methyladenine glycosylase II
MPTDKLVVPSPELRKAIAYICEIDRDFQKIEAEAGVLTVGTRSPDFAALVRIILGQQLSSKAAQAIFLRLNNLIEITPAQLIDCPEIALKEVGLSQTKIATCQRLATTILAGQLNLRVIKKKIDPPTSRN